ncbi:MAG: hypothetical protein E6L04_09280 [Thaumarchaeota archaeon]|nr:MAG: hypothetical protein E6L04_09280 [Nitrososphaerota archaeon]TLX91020.1 MAG: hypothetical protein E6K97_03225 [Nitrososphaerota archaeon]
MVSLMDRQVYQLIEMTIYMSPTRTIIGYKCLQLTEHFLQNLVHRVMRSQFILPEGIGVDRKAGLVYVADTGNYRIQVFRPVASSGKCRLNEVTLVIMP